MNNRHLHMFLHCPLQPILLLAAVCSFAPIAQAKKANVPAPQVEESEAGTNPKKYHVGIGLASPEIVPFEGLVRQSSSFGYRFYFSPPLNINQELNEPADTDQVKSRLQVATPATKIDVNILYGPLVGVDGLWFPFGGGMFVTLGMEYRKVIAQMEEKVPVTVCFVTADEVCNDDTAFYKPSNPIIVKSDYSSYSLIARSSIGYLLDFKESLYASFTFFGLAKPFYTKRRTNASADLNNVLEVDDNNEEIAEATDDYKSTREKRLANRANNKAKKADSMYIPVIGITMGWRF